jgi:hypothetical protein
MSIPRGQLEGITVDVQPHGEPGASDVPQQRVETVEPRLRSELGAFPVFTHRVQQVTHLRQGAAPGLLDAHQRLAILGQRGREPVPDGSEPARTVTVVGVARPGHPVSQQAAIFLTDAGRRARRHRPWIREARRAAGPWRAHDASTSRA